MTEQMDVKFWDCEDSEQLTHTSMDDAIESALDCTDDFPDEITVKGYARCPLPDVDKWSRSMLEEQLDCLNNDYCDPEGYTEPTPKMIEAAKKFAEVLFSEFTVWSCYEVTKRTINVMEWVRENRPDWLEQKGD